MSDCNLVATSMELGAKISKLEGGETTDSNNYRNLIGSLKYLICTTPGISFTVSMTIRFTEDSGYSHLKVVKRILTYIKRTEDLGLQCTKTNKNEHTGYVDSD
jgi:hypothetical protein